jgi:hypothetical protein
MLNTRFKYILMKKIHVIIFLSTILITSCKKEDVTPIQGPDINQQARDALNQLMGEWYLWYNQMPAVKVTDYSDPYKLMTALRYKARDRWSFVADYNAFIASMQGSFVGHGIRIGLDPQDQARIVMIYKNSPMYSKGVRRGWIIKKLNNTDLAPILKSGDGAAYSQLIGAAQAGVTNTFLFQTPAGKDSTITTAKASFQVNSVIKYDTLNLKSGKTGYLVFDEFIEPSSDELKTAFSFLKQQNVKDLVLDLRYNSGGILDVATELASYIAGLSAQTILVKSVYNNKQALNDETIYFKTMLYPLNLTRLVVICTRETASASEVVINGLKPFVNVVLVGDTTNGKPTGMNVWGYKNKFIFAPVTFSLINSQAQGDFYAGFPPSKYVTDDITHDFGARDEYCLKEAIRYLETGSFSTKGVYIYQKNRHFDERSDLMNNTFGTVSRETDKM